MPGQKGPGEFYPSGQGAAGTLAPPAPATTAAGIQAVRQRIDPRQLSVNIQSASGLVYRWGPDEADASRVPTGIHITTQIPGGFGTFDCTLARRPDLSYYDLDRFAPCTVRGASAALTAFDGYLSSRPMDRSSAYTFTPEAIGWSGHMKDAANFTMVYIDRQLSKLASSSLARQAALLSSGEGITAWSAQAVGDSSGNPALVFSATGPIVGSVPERAEMWYDAGVGGLIEQVRITGVVANYTSGAAALSASDSNNLVDLLGADSDATTVALTHVLPGTSAIVKNIPAHRYLAVMVRRAAVSGLTANATYQWAIENPALVGPHGLTIHAGPSGVIPGVDDGFYGGDIITDIVRRAAPELTVVRGPGGVVNDHTAVTGNDSFVVPNLAFNTPVDADTAAQQLNQFYLYDYGVYESKQFFWRPPATGTEWHVRLAEGVQVQDQGPQIETAINGVIVSWTDPAGITRYLGPPPGPWDSDPASGRTYSALLQDTSSSNPCNAYGRVRWPVLQIQGMSTWGAAERVGALYLQAMLNRKESGSVTVTGFAVDSNGHEWPAYMIRAGDTVVIDDQGTSDIGDLAHYILQTNYDHDKLSNTLTLDAPPNRVDWIIQRLNLAIAALG